MKYYLIGSLLGSFLHSEHDTQELCRGREAMLRDKGAIVQCVPAPQGFILNEGIITLTPDSTVRYKQ